MFDELTGTASQILHTKLGVHRKVSWRVPEDPSHGDATTTVALALAKELKKQPREVATILIEALSSSELLEKVEMAGAGYVNVWLKPEVLLKELNRTREACVPKVAKKSDPPVIVEYSQPNIAKPLGAHHLLSTVIGQSISNLHEHAGHPVIRWNYIGDWGTQFGKLAVAFTKWGSTSARECSLDSLLSLYVRFHDEAERDASLEDEAREAFRRLEEGDAKLRAFRDDVVAVTKASLGHIYERLHVRFDLDLGEAFYNDKMEPVLEEGKKKGVFRVGEKGALIVEFPSVSDLPVYVVLKGDGATLYSTRDIAQMRYRIDTYHPKGIFIVTDIAQKLHFQQLAATCKLLGWTLPDFENVLVGRMRFGDKSMSTRKGNILKLDEVLDEAVRRADKVIEEHRETIQTDDRRDLAEMMGIGSVAYAILSQNRTMDIVFDWDKMLSFTGNSAPYLQYTHARARSVLRKAAEEGISFSAVTEVASLTQAERILIRTLLLFPEIFADALATHMPHKIAVFLYSLCQDFNAFYNKEPILKADEHDRSLRLQLTADTAQVLATAASLLTLRLPDRM